MDLERLTEFVRLTHEYRSVQRALEIYGGTRNENDLEHAGQLALLAWYLNDRDRLGLDNGRIMGMALAHDLVEIHAGDTYMYGSEADRSSQAAREQQAIARLGRDWADFPHLHALIAEYEAGETPEAKFVYSLDKLIPMLNNYTDDGRGWRQKNVSFATVKAAKTGKADRSPAVAPYFKALLAALERSPQMFPPHPAPDAPKTAGPARDRQWLQRARLLAAGSPEPIGCGVVLVAGDGRVLAEATNSQRADNQAVYHAEIKAIMAANQLSHNRTLPSGSTAYCSCEPCAMCLAALSNAKVSRVVYDQRMADLFPADRQAKFDAQAFVAGLNSPFQLEHLPLA